MVGPDWEGALAAINEGIPLIWVPRAAIASDLMSAPDAASRGQVLAEARRDIAGDCAAVLAEVAALAFLSLAALSAASARALGDGHCEAAQALAANVFDRWLRDVVDRGVLFGPAKVSPRSCAAGQSRPRQGDVRS